MSGDLSLKQIQSKWHGTIKAYVIGFIASLSLTAASFLLTLSGLLPNNILVYTLVGLALAQAICQLLFFLHLGQEDKPQWETLVFYFMVMVLLIIAIGSLWIMNDLNDRMMSNMTMAISYD